MKMFEILEGLENVIETNGSNLLWKGEIRGGSTVYFSKSIDITQCQYLVFNDVVLAAVMEEDSETGDLYVLLTMPVGTRRIQVGAIFSDHVTMYEYDQVAGVNSIEMYDSEVYYVPRPIPGKNLKMWTKENRLVCDLSSGTKVYFFSQTYKVPLVKTVYIEDEYDYCVVDIPDILLTKHENIKVQIDENDYYQTFEVVKRTKPEDYDINLKEFLPDNSDVSSLGIFVDYTIDETNKLYIDAFRYKDGTEITVETKDALLSAMKTGLPVYI